MVVCLCQGVSEKQVRKAIGRGACSRKAVTRACGAGGVCGGCHDTIKGLIQEERSAGASSAADAVVEASSAADAVVEASSAADAVVEASSAADTVVEASSAADTAVEVEPAFA